MAPGPPCASAGSAPHPTESIVQRRASLTRVSIWPKCFSGCSASSSLMALMVCPEAASCCTHLLRCSACSCKAPALDGMLEAGDAGAAPPPVAPFALLLLAAFPLDRASGDAALFLPVMLVALARARLGPQRLFLTKRCDLCIAKHEEQTCRHRCNTGSALVRHSPIISTQLAPSELHHCT